MRRSLALVALVLTACPSASPAALCADVVCVASDACHDVGTCDPQTGSCSNPAKQNGTVCNDGDSCTLADSCQNGACVAGAPKTCTASDQCHDVGSCDPQTGNCANPAKQNDTACTDGNSCTLTDSCQSGACVGGNS